MASEIELKIPLSAVEYESLYNSIWINKNVTEITILDADNREVLKTDEYYSKYKTLEERKKNGEPPVIRIRTEIVADEKKSFFTIKVKKIENGLEINKEDETFIENAEVLRELFKEAGYWNWFYKEKKAVSAHCSLVDFNDTVFHVELVVVNGLKYVEIEVTGDNLQEESVKKALEMFVLKLGLLPEKKDERSWYKIISEMKSI